MITVRLLGFSSGLPLALAGDTLKVWLADRDVDLSTIGLLSLAGMPYCVMFVWAPVVRTAHSLAQHPPPARLARCLAAAADRRSAPARHARSPRRAAERRAVRTIGRSRHRHTRPSTTQDIVVDAYRVEILAPEEQAAGMAGYVAAYRVGMLVAGAGVIGLVAWLALLGLERTAAWPIAYALAAILVGVGLVATLAAGEPYTDANTARACRTHALQRVWLTGAGALREFLARKAAARVLAFVLFYKLCDAFGQPHGAIRRSATTRARTQRWSKD